MSTYFAPQTPNGKLTDVGGSFGSYRGANFGFKSVVDKLVKALAAYWTTSPTDDHLYWRMIVTL